ncbi:tyrosine-type recombinase/integrase [Pedobacter sp. UC225_65]|uniref:tyrosine-type recombinase/integrase n=1 Tax=Pedobacter sp. UC225_65 TaxID=3350173 RepID=UPI00366B3DE9
MKYLRIDLATKNKISFKLIVPTKKNIDKYPKYYIEYTYNAKQYQVTKNIKKLYLHFEDWAKKMKIDKADRHAKLVELFSVNVNDIMNTLDVNTEDDKSKVIIGMYSGVLKAINAFLNYQKGQHSIGELAGMTNYLDRNRKLNSFFVSHHHDILIKELTATVWDEFRVFLKNQNKANSTINQYITYVKSWYNWLIKYHDIPIMNHANKLKKLDTNQQEKKYKNLDGLVVQKFFNAVASSDKWLRLDLISRLVAENTIRPIQVRNIRSKDINLVNSRIEVFDKKGKKWRTIIITKKVKELIETIYANTEKRNIVVEEDDYLIGGYNSFKKGKPYTQNMIKDILITPFRNEFPELKSINIYDFKHTSITKSSKRGNLREVQRRAGHSKITTTQGYDLSEAVSEPISVEELIAIK